MNVVQFRKKTGGGAHNAFARARADVGNSSQVPPPAGVHAIGIDLGTTNSVVSVYRPGAEHPETLVYDNAQLVPSMLYWDAITHTDIVGALAKVELERDPSQVVRSTKRSMGDKHADFQSGDKTYSPEDAAALILGHITKHPFLQDEAARHGGIWAVVTVPAHFDDAARMATIAAARAANIHVLRIVNEPTAAALAYSMFPEVRHVQSENLAVFDLGGGTFDVSIVERDGLIFNVLSSEGDVRLGGDDLDEALAQHMRASVIPQITARRATKTSELFRKLLWHAENVKIAFQTEGVVSLSDSDLDGSGSSLEVTLTRDTFELLATPFIQRTLDLTQRAMHAAKRRPQHITRILLVGGSTRVGLVRKMLAEFFPTCQVDARLEPDLAVSWGAAVQAAIILGKEPDTILVDVCSHTLGIGVAEDSHSVGENFKKVAKQFGITKPVTDDELHAILGLRIEEFNFELQKLLHVAPIIHRNSPLPARRSEFFSTLYNDQAGVHVVVVQGENDCVGDNRLLGAFLFDLEQPCAAGSRCEIQLTYDINGMVHVLARQLGTENEAEAVFDSRTGEVSGWRSLRTEDADDIEPTESSESTPEPEPVSSLRKPTQLPPIPNLIPNLIPHHIAHHIDVTEGEIGTTPTAENSVESNVVSLSFGKASVRSHMADEILTDHSKNQANDVPPATVVLNGLIARARREIGRLERDSEIWTKLTVLLSHYVELLNDARNGAFNDEAMEEAECALLESLESLSRS